MKATQIYKNNLFSQPCIFREKQPIYPSITNTFEYWLMNNTSYPARFIRTTPNVLFTINQLKLIVICKK
jgi:hypothetical protein